MTKTGGLFTYTHFNNKIVGVVSLSCETDFAEKTEVFKKLGTDLAMLVASYDIDSMDDFLKEECLDGSETVTDKIATVSKSLKEKIFVVKFQKITF